MYIKKAEIFTISIPLIDSFRTSFMELNKRTVLVLKLYDKSGLIGIGESPGLDIPIYTSDFHYGTILLLRDYLIPSLLNKEINTIDDLLRSYSHIIGNNYAKIALEASFWHLKSQQNNIPLYKLWGGNKEKIAATISIGFNGDIKGTVEKVKKYVDRFKLNKLKVKIKPGIDIEFVEKLRELFPDFSIRIDANGAYTLKDLDMFKQLDTLGLTMIEQPLMNGDLVDHSILQKKLKTPICLDESIHTIHDAEQAAKIKACRIVNIKPARVGGFWESKKIAEYCASQGISVWCGGLLETGWGQLFNCSIATLPNFRHDNDICLTKWYLKDDIIQDEIKEKNGHINIEDVHRIYQKQLDENKFEKYIVDKVIIE